MTKEEILQGLKEVIAIIKPKIDASNVSMETELGSELGIDSLSLLLLSLAVEDKFKIKFDTQERFETVGQVVEFIAKSV